MATRRGEAARWSDGLAVGIAAVGVLALAERAVSATSIGPGAPPSFFPAEDRLSWPLNYWNGLGIFVGLGYPLLLRAATAGGAGRLARAGAGADPGADGGDLPDVLARRRRDRGLRRARLHAAHRPPAVRAASRCVVAAAGAAAAVAVLVARHALVDGPPGTAAAASQADSAAVLLALLGVGVALAYWAWIRFGEPRVGAELGRAPRRSRMAGAACLVAGGRRRGRRPGPEVQRLQGAARASSGSTRRLHQGAPAERERQRPLADLGQRGGPVRRAPGDGRRRRLVRGVVGPERDPAEVPARRALALSRDDGRARACSA